MEKVVTPSGEFYRTKLPASEEPYFLEGQTTVAGMAYAKYRWIDREYLSRFPHHDPNAMFLNFISEKYDANGNVRAVKAYLWQDAARLGHVVTIPSGVYVHFTSVLISEPSHAFEIYFLVGNEAEYESWLTERGLVVLTERTGMSHYLHCLKIDKFTKEILGQKRYYRDSPLNPYGELYRTVDGTTVRRRY